MTWPPPDGWPNRAASRQVRCAPHRWHLQTAGTGKTVLLLHGAGASTSSWRDVFPALAQTFRVAAVDLPGHGFTSLGPPASSGLDGMAANLHALCVQEDLVPDAIVGHSAGAAIALRLCEVAERKPGAVVGLNAALGKFDGLAGVLFPVIAKGLAAVPFTASVFSALAGRRRQVAALLGSTGSAVDDAALDSYLPLVRDPDHVKGALTMMAQWRLDGLLSRLDQIDVPTLFLAGAYDRTVPPRVSQSAAAAVPGAQVEILPGLGHLAHEEAPDEIAGRIAAFISAV
ncbi:MAG: alpha/beta fold hydrolase [Rhodobacter sp.]|nr:alpha/beta fold hydrolase [Rhodobacter sp.]